MVERELTRRQILIALGIGIATPLVGCGGGSSASTPPPPRPPPLDITPTVTFGVIGTYVGDVATNVPKDASGAPTSFYLLVPGSGNDSTYTDAEVQAAATYVAQQIVARFPTAIPIFTGVFGDCSAGDSVIGAADISRNAALAAAAAYLPKIGGKVPFIDTYQAGLGGLKIINGLGTVADPQAGTNSNYKSITEPGHPTGPGSQFLSDWLVPQVKTLIA